MKKIEYNTLLATLVGLGGWFAVLIFLPVDIITRLNIIVYIAAIMFVTSNVYFATLIYKGIKNGIKIPLGLQSIGLLSVLATISTIESIRQPLKPEVSAGVLFFYSGIFLYTAIKGANNG